MHTSILKLKYKQLLPTCLGQGGKIQRMSTLKIIIKWLQYRTNPQI